jgi:hypothetical protein
MKYVKIRDLPSVNPVFRNRLGMFRGENKKVVTVDMLLEGGIKVKGVKMADFMVEDVKDEECKGK